MKTGQNTLRRSRNRSPKLDTRSHAWVFILVAARLGGSSFAQVTLTRRRPRARLTPASGAPLTITLQDALQRARQNDPQYRSAITDLGLAREDRVQARAGLLPNLNYNNSFIYTQGTGQCRVLATAGAHFQVHRQQWRA